MRDEHYSPFEPAPERRSRASTGVFVVIRRRGSTIETMTGSLRDVDGQRWEVLYLLNGDLYISQVCLTRELAEAHLKEHGDALEAAGWTPHAVRDSR